jgi:hypothetical protein
MHCVGLCAKLRLNKTFSVCLTGPLAAPPSSLSLWPSVFSGFCIPARVARFFVLQYTKIATIYHMTTKYTYHVNLKYTN